jgi:hypothetical protein
MEKMAAPAIANQGFRYEGYNANKPLAVHKIADSIIDSPFLICHIESKRQAANNTNAGSAGKA